MRIQILTIFPELFESFLATSLVGRALEKGLMEVEVHDLRDYTEDRHRSVDDEPYGGGGGMVMTAPPWLNAVRAVSSSGAHRVLMSPQGRRLDDAAVRRLAARLRGPAATPDGEAGGEAPREMPSGELVILCGRYEGLDERVIESVVDEEISIGDYVLSGGELPAMVLVEALSRQIPGVVGLPDSVARDSFREGLLDHPHYTRPPLVEGRAVPEVLTSGDHAAIDRWRRREALLATRRKRPDLLAALPAGEELTPEERHWLKEDEADGAATDGECGGTAGLLPNRVRLRDDDRPF